MKKKTYHLFFFICFVLLLTGCGEKKPLQTTEESVIPQIDALNDAEADTTADEQIEKAVWNVVEEPETVIEEASGAEMTSEFEQIVVETEQTQLDSATKNELELARKKLGLTEENIPALKAVQEKNYYYGCLNEEEQLLYVELFQILIDMEEGIMLTTKDVNLIPRVYQAVINDHPELFYTKGFVYTKATLDGEIIYLTCSGSYTYTKEEAAVRMQQIEA